MSLVAEDLRAADDARLLAILDAASKWPEHEYYAHAELGYETTGLMASSALLQAPPTFKAYRGHIGIGSTPRHIDPSEATRWCAFATYGKRDGEQMNFLGWFDDLSQALAVVNKQLASKTTTRKGYVPVPGTGPSQISRQQVITTMEWMIAAGLLA